MNACGAVLRQNYLIAKLIISHVDQFDLTELLKKIFVGNFDWFLNIQIIIVNFLL